ncbi:hypothetical protein [Falsiroseomonas oryzae]|uniref:hypothetical protein n=1 Tax=Falsiroseomonas oryzae TaxID=2766473 RepID=UPI0022EAD1B0|nr:hypothetical protein [Roseomonas sp. MO-31]
MPRPAPKLTILLAVLALLAACTAPIQDSRIQAPHLALQQAPLAPPRGAEADARFQACRAEAERLVLFRERGQSMRSDDLASSAGGFSTSEVLPRFRQQLDQASSQAERDRLTRECMASREPVPQGTGGTTGR